MDFKLKITVAAFAFIVVMYTYYKFQNKTEEERSNPTNDAVDEKHDDTILTQPQQNDIQLNKEQISPPNIQIKQAKVDSVVIEITNKTNYNKYKIEYSQTDSDDWKSITITSNINEYEIKKLTPSTKYSIRTISINNNQQTRLHSEIISFETDSANTIDAAVVKPNIDTQVTQQNENVKEADTKTADINDEFSNEILLDRCYGCVIGAAIGDSIGSYCEFRSRGIDKEELDTAMNMPGGGTWGKKVITGQVTDDTELAVSLAYGLIKIIGKSEQMTRLSIHDQKQHENKTDVDSKEQMNDEKLSGHVFDLGPIGVEYRRWKSSHPFDIGICTRQTLNPSPDIAKMKLKADEYNKNKRRGNQANGALMRCMALCLYGYKLSHDNLYILMKEDASLTHANMGVYLVNTCYAIMIQYLLTAELSNEKRNLEAYGEMIQFLENVSSEEDGNEKGETAQILLDDWLGPFIKKKNSYTLNDLREATRSQGWVKIAFQRCCYHLLKGSEYKEAMRSVVGEGGDTDTNACIVGGLMGVYWGLKNIPKEYVDNIKNCNPILDENRDKFQAKWYFKDKIPELLIENAPSNESFKIVDKY